MKTTIELPDSLAAAAREVARAQGTTLREVIEAGLRAELDRRSQPAPARPFRFRTVGGHGLQAGIDPRDLREHAYDDAP